MDYKDYKLLHEILRVAEANNGLASLDYMVREKNGGYTIETCGISAYDLNRIPSLDKIPANGHPRLSEESQAILDGLMPVKFVPEENATQIYKDFRAWISQLACQSEDYNHLDERTLIAGFNALIVLIDKKYIEGAIKILCPEKYA